MEVLSVISDREDLVDIFQEILDNDPEIIEVGRDSDTAYYDNKEYGYREFYFHFDIYDEWNRHDLILALNEDEIKAVEEYFGLELEKLYVFAVSYKSEKSLRRILRAFQEALLSRGISLSHVLIDHPFERLKKLEELVCEEEDDEEGVFTKLTAWLKEVIGKFFLT